MNKVWFAEKQNGDIIELSEIEALTHFENNNIAQRMRLRFLGTGDGSKFAEAQQEVQKLMSEQRIEQYPNYGSLNVEEKRYADFQLQDTLRPQIKEILTKGREAELEQAKANGVQKPDPSLRIITKSEGVDASREKIINSMNI
jgi:hypothetical protein